MKSLPTAEAVAAEFAKVLRTWLTPEEFTEMRCSNRGETDEGVCHSHDFCDANMAMLRALTNLGVPEDSVNYQDDATLELWNSAWDIAKRDYLS